MLQKCRKRKTPNLQHDLEKTLNSKETKAKLTEITKIVKNMNENNAVDYTLKEIEKLLTNDSRSIQNEALQSNENVQPNKKLKKPRFKRKEPWYNLECRTLKRNLDYTCKALNKDPNNPHLRGNFYKIKKKIKKTDKENKNSF